MRTQTDVTSILGLDYISDCPGNMGNWKERHLEAVRRAVRIEVGSTVPNKNEAYPAVIGIKAWVQYATSHAKRYESDIGKDYVLGPAWRDWGLALRALLNGELGYGVDAGTLDHIIVENLTRQGYGGDL